MPVPALSELRQALWPRGALSSHQVPAGELQCPAQGRGLAPGRYLYQIHRGGAGLPVGRVLSGMSRNRYRLFLEIQQEGCVVRPCPDIAGT